MASLRSLSRYGRPDVNAITTVPPDSILGFRAEISVPGGRKQLANDKLRLRMRTSTDSQEVVIPVQSSPVLAGLSNFLRKVALLGHPRRTTRRLLDKYWGPRWQKHVYHNLIRRTERYDETAVRNEISLFAYQPLISLLVPVYNV